MACIDSVISRWLDTLDGATDRRGNPLRNLSGSRVYGEGHTLYSYGRHFPLAEYFPRDHRRRTPLFLLNGDRSTVSTSRHQRETRAAIGRPAGSTGAQVAVIPFSALDGAGIVRSSILPLEVRPDTMLDVRHESPSLEDVPLYIRETYVSRSADVFEGVPADVAARGWGTYSYEGQWVDRSTGRYHWTEPVTLQPDADGVYRWTTQVHRLGDCLFTADTLHRIERARDATLADIVDNARWGTLERDIREDGTILEPTTVRRRRRYVSSFDRNEPQPLYFLATLPHRSRARTVEDAIHDLAPPAVHAALARGRNVDRQGDIFAIATTLRDEDLTGPSYRHARHTLHSRGSAPRAGEPGYVRPLTAAERRALTARARVLWRARFATLRPDGPQSTARQNHERREGIATERRQLETARARGRSAVLRGDGIFASRARYAIERTRERLTALLAGPAHRDTYRHTGYGLDVGLQPGTIARDLWRTCHTDAYYELRPGAKPAAVDRAQREARAILRVHGTAHTATRVVVGPGGRTYLSGSMIHDPSIAGEQWRRRDHVRRPLEPGVWYLAVRNTVPRATADTRRGTR